MPADDVAAALEQVSESAPALFDELRLPNGGVEAHATPRRIVVIARNVEPYQTDEEFIAKGPPADRAYDIDGKPTRAAIGFARGKGVDVSDLLVKDLDGGRYVTAVVRNQGQPATDVLAEALSDFIAGIKFRKSMRWNASGATFSRPIRWILALFGEAVIPFEYAGVASGNVTRGLRPLGSPAMRVLDVASYEHFCVRQGIILDSDKRKAVIREQIERQLDFIQGLYRTSGSLEFVQDELLLAEVTNLVEAPTAFFGFFDEAFTALPTDLLKTVMRKHQRYFMLEFPGDGYPCVFVGVRNGDDQHIDNVQLGNEQVLRARFSDARFFYEADITVPLASYLSRLETLTFQAELGSMREKNDRVAATVDDLGKLIAFNTAEIDVARQAAKLAKADLATSMVVEMTSLQGIMGREYALREGIDPAVATAIREHWLPEGADDELPASAAGRLLALADKLDSLIGLIAVGLAPKSTSDPFGLRRSALGIIRILVDANLQVDLRELIGLVASRQPTPVNSSVKQEILDFVAVRLDRWLSDNTAYRRDVIKAVLVAQAQNPAGAAKGVVELAEWVEKENWEAILDSFARCARITREETARTVNPDLFREPAERELHAAYMAASERVSASASVNGFLSAIETMAPAVTEFFDKVLVHAKDDTLRNNRIALLQLISAMQEGKADLSELENF